MSPRTQDLVFHTRQRNKYLPWHNDLPSLIATVYAQRQALVKSVRIGL